MLALVARQAPLPATWANAMRKRGWTPDQIDEAIVNGRSHPAQNKVHPENQATRYIHPETGRSVVRDNVTQAILHVGGESFTYD